MPDPKVTQTEIKVPLGDRSDFLDMSNATHSHSVLTQLVADSVANRELRGKYANRIFKCMWFCLISIATFTTLSALHFDVPLLNLRWELSPWTVGVLAGSLGAGALIAGGSVIKGLFK